MPRGMGSSSSQVVAPSQAATQDAAAASRIFSQPSGPDGTQEDEGPPRKRVASNMDAKLEDTVKKAKRARKKDAARGKGRSVPQHLRGFAIQPSQDLLHTQEDAHAAAGAGNEDIQGAVEGGDDAGKHKADVLQPVMAGEGDIAKTKRPLPKKKRTNSQAEAAEPTVGGADAGPGALEDMDINALDSKIAPAATNKKRKRRDIELERLRKDVEDFAPHMQSTPKPKPSTKRQARAKDGPTIGAIDEKPEPDAEDYDGTVRAKPQKRTKRTQGQNRDEPTDGREPEANASTRRAKRKRAHVEAVAQPEAVEGDIVSAAEEAVPIRVTEEVPPADSILTPPDSPDAPVPDDERARDEVDARLPGHAGNADEQAQKGASAGSERASEGDLPFGQNLKKLQRAKKRKRAAGHTEGNQRHEPDNNDNEKYNNDQTDQDEESTPIRARKAKRPKKTSSNDENRPGSGRGEIQGTWSREEKALADETFYDIVRVTAVPDWELKANIIDWKNPTPPVRQLKEAFYEAFPKRSVKSIMRFCQRRYNAYDRGKWTAEDDQALRKAYELSPDEWTVISDSVGRFWEDCRMRWRDVLSRSAKAQTGPWSRKEELRLAKAVQECRALIMKETEDPKAREDPEKADALISWKVVADKMENTRAAKRCREKWSRIKHLDLSATALPAATQSATSNKPSDRVREAQKEYRRCEAGDVYDMIGEICSAVPDVTTVFEHETTFWSIVAIRNPDSKFTSALRLKALTAAIDDYSCKAVRDAKTLASKAKGVQARMEALEGTGRIELMRTYDGKPKPKPAVEEDEQFKAEAENVFEDGMAAIGQKQRKKATAANPRAIEDEVALSRQQLRQEDANKPSKPAANSKAKKAKTTAKLKPNTNKYKSADFVVESDDDEGTAGYDVQVPHSQSASENSAPDDEEKGDDDEDADGGAEDRKPGCRTDELGSLGSGSPVQSPSTMIGRFKGKGKGKKRMRGGIKGEARDEVVEERGRKRGKGER